MSHTKKPKITVDKSGLIIGINRYTEIPYAALELSEHNMMHPQQAKKRVFGCRESKKTNEPT